jgi:glutathione synthase/RimK-type ligase-like ATP-grasp enzyme
VVSDADDYRYSPEEVEFEACELPAEIADCAKKLAAALNLTLAGLDLRHASNGEWYCFEVNPSPAFTAYTRVTGQPIAQAVARLLATERSGQVSSMRRMN